MQSKVDKLSKVHYIIGFAIAICMVCSIIVSSAAVGLRAVKRRVVALHTSRCEQARPRAGEPRWCECEQRLFTPRAVNRRAWPRRGRRARRWTEGSAYLASAPTVTHSSNRKLYS